jgi:hypothetical protein
VQSYKPCRTYGVLTKAEADLIKERAPAFAFYLPRVLILSSSALLPVS